MGRVYKALVKADRWGAGPVARPETGDRKAQGESPRVTEDFRFDYGFAAPQTAAGRSEQATAPAPAPRPRVEPAQGSLASRLAASASMAQKPAARKAAAEKPIEQATAPAPAFEEPGLSISVADIKLEARFAAFTGADAVASEKYRALAIRVLNFAPRADLKTLLVTSAQSGEGKSTVAANLAWSLAKRDERRVLLVEANAKADSIAMLESAALSGVVAERGLMDLIDGATRLSDALCRVDPNGLYVMAAGRSARDAAAALASSKGERLMRELSKDFDLVVIDAPAMLESADVERLASIADATLLVARSGHTHREFVAEAVRLIPERRRCGVVLNEAEHAAGHKKPGRLFGRKARHKG